MTVTNFPCAHWRVPGTVTVDGYEEYFVDKIVDEKMVGKRKYYPGEMGRGGG